jgi:hypothetical protein
MRRRDIAKGAAIERGSRQGKEGALVYWHVLTAIKWVLVPVFVLCAGAALWDVARYGYVDIRASLLAVVSMAVVVIIARQERKNPNPPDDDA